ncbi:MAG: GtrA family protein [Candidatus Nanopelagicales bacterium]
MYDKPLTAKIVSVCVATTVAYFGNRYWTFRHRGRTASTASTCSSSVLNGVGLAISVGCLWFSHYALGLTGPLADNISANVVGLALGTMFRFWSTTPLGLPRGRRDRRGRRDPHLGLTPVGSTISR